MSRTQLQYAPTHPLKPSPEDADKNSARSHSSGSSTPKHSADLACGPVPAWRAARSKTSLASSVSSSSLVAASSDPLTSALEGSDPLSQYAAAAAVGDNEEAFQPVEPRKKTVQRGKPFSPAKEIALDGLEPWYAKKNGVLAKYTTSEKLSIVTSFLTGGEKVVVTTTDKVKTQLEQLDDFEEGSVREMLGLTQQDYVSRIQQLNSELSLAWSTDQRVKSLKIAIQCAKLLTTADVLNFYPSKFVLVTDLLDNFGNLVFNRLKSKDLETNQTGSRNYGVAGANETARNWFYKIASIRELIPRFYLETAILKSYRHFTHSDVECKETLMRLAKMTRGIGNPLVAAYARCYLAKIATEVVGYCDEKKYIMTCIDDILDAIPRMYSGDARNQVAAQKMDFSTYLTLYTPALDYMLECAALRAPETLFAELLDRCRRLEANGAVFLNSLLTAFKPDFVATNALEVVELMNQQEASYFPQHVLYRSLGLCLVVADPDESLRLQLINQVWKGVSKLPTAEQYMTCAEVWIQFILKHFSKREINAFLGDIVKHVSVEKDRSALYPSLHCVVDKVLLYVTDFAVLFGLDKFLPLLDLFENEPAKVDACKMILEAYLRQRSVSPSSEPDLLADPFLIGALMNVCSTIHNSLNALTVTDEKRQVASLINGFVQTVSYGRDFEALLNFYVDARAAFTSLDVVMACLVQRVNALAMSTLEIMDGAHSKKTASFVRACIAFCFITIPSMDSALFRLDLYLLTGRVALTNQCWGQAEACFHAILDDLRHVPTTVEMDGRKQHTDHWMEQHVMNLLSALLVVPDPPEVEQLGLVKRLLEVLNVHHWERHCESLFKINLGVLQLLSTTVQDLYPYRIEGVDSNNALYGGHSSFLAEVNDLAGKVIDELLFILREFGDLKLTQRQATLGLLMFDVVVNFGDLQEPSLLKLSVNLWNLFQKKFGGSVSHKSLIKRLDALKIRARVGGDDGASVNELIPCLHLRSTV